MTTALRKALEYYGFDSLEHFIEENGLQYIPKEDAAAVIIESYYEDTQWD